MPRPAPPVGHTGVVTFGPPGMGPTPTENLAAFCTPIDAPVDPQVALVAPAEKSLVSEFPDITAHLSL